MRNYLNMKLKASEYIYFLTICITPFLMLQLQVFEKNVVLYQILSLFWFPWSIHFVAKEKLNLVDLSFLLVLLSEITAVIIQISNRIVDQKVLLDIQPLLVNFIIYFSVRYFVSAYNVRLIFRDVFVISLFIITISGLVPMILYLIFGMYNEYFLTGFNEAYFAMPRMKAFIGDPNIAACMATILLPFSYSKDLNNETYGILKMIAKLNILLVPVVVIISFSRTAWISYGVLLFLMSIVKSTRKAVRTALLVVLMFLLLSTAIFPQLRDSLSIRIYQFKSDFSSSSYNRFGIWNDYVEVIKGNRFIGIGFDNLVSFSKVNIYTDASGRYAHNSFIEILSWIGLFGIPYVLFWIIIVPLISLKRFSKANPIDKIHLMSIIPLLILLSSVSLISLDVAFVIAALTASDMPSEEEEI